MHLSNRNQFALDKKLRRATKTLRQRSIWPQYKGHLLSVKIWVLTEFVDFLLLFNLCHETKVISFRLISSECILKNRLEAKANVRLLFLLVFNIAVPLAARLQLENLGQRIDMFVQHGNLKHSLHLGKTENIREHSSTGERLCCFLKNG